MSGLRQAAGDGIVPIKKQNRARYPKNWEQIRQRILDRAGDQCECRGECGLHHDHRCVERNGNRAHFAKGRIVLTVAHLDHAPENCEPKNLRAMCQRCHLRYDTDHHKETRQQTKREKLEADGQTSLWLDERREEG